MSDYIKEIMEKIKEKIDVILLDYVVTHKGKKRYLLGKTGKELTDLFSLSLTRVEEAERERIAKAMQPAFDDFNAAAHGYLKRQSQRIAVC